MHNHTGCISLTFLYWVFSNVWPATQSIFLKFPVTESLWIRSYFRDLCGGDVSTVLELCCVFRRWRMSLGREFGHWVNSWWSICLYIQRPQAITSRNDSLMDRRKITKIFFSQGYILVSCRNYIGFPCSWGRKKITNCFQPRIYFDQKSHCFLPVHEGHRLQLQNHWPEQFF